MICQEIYDMALSFISEPGVSPGSDDYRVRAPYMLSAAAYELEGPDRAYRRYLGMDAAHLPQSLRIPLDAEFPLCDRICPAAAYYLASALIFDEDPAMSERLYDKYAESVATIYREIPGEIRSITDCYGYKDEYSENRVL